MIIRTSMAERAAAAYTVAAPRLSQRELRRLQHTKHPAQIVSEEKEEKKEEIPIVIEEVREENTQTQAVVEPGSVIIRSKALAEANQIIAEQEASSDIARPGTAKIRSKALEEIDIKPKKKYKVISIGK